MSYLKDCLRFLGLYKSNNDVFTSQDKCLKLSFRNNRYVLSDAVTHKTIISSDINFIANYILSINDEHYDYEEHLISGCKMCTLTPVFAKDKINRYGGTGSRQGKMIRVRSSNVWSYSFEVKDLNKKLGDLFVQFKGKNGCPGDIYQYFDVPVRLWSKFVATNSKGHFFWKYVRNIYLYRKLTGDKHGKLKNAVN